MKSFSLQLALFACCLSFACSKDESTARGQLMLAVSTDMAIPKDLDELHVEVLTYGSVQFSNDYDLGPGSLQLPATLGILGGDDPSRPATIRVLGNRNGVPRVLREVVTTIPTDRVAMLRINLAWLCIDHVTTDAGDDVVTTCDQGETCIAGSCESATLDSAELPDYAPEEVFGGGDGTGSGDCFDTVACFSDGAEVAVDPGTCSIVSGDANASVALVRPPETEGICGPEACLVPLDSDAWTVDEGRILLPAAACEHLATGNVNGVAVTTACQPKTVSLPLCGPWSSIDNDATFDAVAPEPLAQGGSADAAGNAEVPGLGGVGTGGVPSSQGGAPSDGGAPTTGGAFVPGGSAGESGSAPVSLGGGTVQTGGAPNGGATSDGGAWGGGGAASGGQAVGGRSGGAGATTQGGVTQGGSTSGGAPGGGSEQAGAPSGGVSGSGSAAGGPGNCLVGAMLQRLGKQRPLIGAQMTDDTAAAAPFDARYLYLAGGIFDGTEPCNSCDTTCTSAGVSCDSADGCSWWGCWQEDPDSPGAYARSLVTTAEGDDQIPMFTYYEILQSSGAVAGSAEVAATNDPTFMARLLADYRYFLQQVGSQRAFVHVEPDFWAYSMQVNADPHAIPSAVASANPTDCGAQENSVAGLGRCFIQMTRAYAPNALVGLHASAWSTGENCMFNTNPGRSVETEAERLATFLTECGADQADFLVVESSDRDAGYYDSMSQDTWWDDQNQTLPNFDQAFRWARALAEAVQKPLVWWQMPLGNMQLANTTGAWQDNRLDYFFDHMDEVTASHAFAVLFGAGADGQTTPETDGGRLLERTIQLAGSEPFVCP